MIENYRGYQIEIREDYLGLSEAVIRQAPDPEEITVFAGVEDEDALRGAKMIVDEFHRAP